jgi:hypothetical protein
MLHAETANGYVVGMIIVIVLSALAVLIGLAAGALFGPDDRDKLVSIPGAIIGIVCGGAVAALCWGIFTWATWPPFSPQYHTYVPVTMTVKEVSSRFISDGGGSVNQRVAITSADGTIYGCDDTRCTTLQPGQVVTLLCVKEWEGNGVPGEVCNWGKTGPNN